MKLLALVLLLSAFSSLTLTEVVSSFKNFCPSFFLRNPEKQNERIVPTIFTGRQYKKICQRWNNGYRFATVYDTERRIPVYSAYTFYQEVKKKKTKRPPWKIEPQLDKIMTYQNGTRIKDTREMIDSPSREQAIAMHIHNQAVDSDYTGSGYTRGHVFPCSFAADQDQANSTFTLTNVAPQTNYSNGNWSKKVEEPMQNEINSSCILNKNHLAYIVTGVVPGNRLISIRRNKEIIERVNIPSHYWSAFCCTSKKDINKLIGKAYIAELDVQQSPLNIDVRQPSIDNLNKRLSYLYNQTFSVFPGLSV